MGCNCNSFKKFIVRSNSKPERQMAKKLAEEHKKKTEAKEKNNEKEQ